MYALVDCNNFYASCERVFRPDLNGKPVCVLSNNDGCVIARSNEAKVIGIPMGAPAFKFKDLFERHRVSVFSANFALYGDMSSRVMSILSEFSPVTEVYSIDEVFIGFDGLLYDDPEALGELMRKKVLQCTGIPISVGFAPTKSLAKVANRIAKKFPQLNSVYVINSEEKIIKALKWLAIGDVWGIGRQHSKRLKNMGVHNALDFTALDDSVVRKYMSVVGVRLKHDLMGERMIELDDVKNKKNIATTRSFDRNYTELDELRERVCSFAVACAEKLRKQDSDCNAIMVFVHTNGFRTDQPQYSMNTVIQLPYPSNSSVELAKFAILGLERIFKPGYLYKKAGVIVQDFTPSGTRQLTMFETSDERHGALMRVVDKINGIFGQQKVKLARQDQKRLWKMKQERLSPRYTTRLSEVLTVNV